MKKYSILVIALWLAMASTYGQQIVLDSPVKAAELTLFPDMEDPNTYYYLSDKPKIAKHPDGKPMFSFLRFVENVKSQPGAASSKSEGEGGGIVHALVTLEITPEQLADAEQALKRINSNGKIQGPIVYTGGTIALISSIAQPNGEFAKTVIGLGKAPVLDGQKAAISVLLTKKGAKILRESFNTPTPDMSVTFEMTVSGFRKPKKAIIEANFDQVYEHKAFQAAVAAPILQAEINAAFTDLTRSGAIKVINKGADEQMEKLIEDAYTKLTRMMFEPTSGSGTPSFEQLANTAGGRPSLMDRASNMLNAARQETRAENAAIRAENQASNNAAASELPPAPPPAEAGTGRETAPPAPPTDPRPRLRTEPRAPSPHVVDHARRNPPPAPGTAGNPARPGTGNAPRQEGTVPGFAIAASFEMKRIRQTGTYRIDLEKWSKDNLTLRFDGNFGGINCPECMRDVNLDDKLYRQREVTAFLDGSDSQDFGKYINFVSVMLKKKHESGEITEDDLRIDKNNFNAEGNNFTLMYGWHNDNNTAKWADYEYKTVWNYFGGGLVESPWQKSVFNTIPLASPFIRNEILVESDPAIMTEKGIRSAEIRFFFKIADKDQSKSVRLNMKQGQYSGSAEIYTPRSNTSFEYEVVWFKNDGSPINSPRMKGNASVIYIDNIPNQ